MSVNISYKAKGSVVEGDKGWLGKATIKEQNDKWLLVCKLSILNGSTSSHTTKESKIAEDQSSKEETREVKTTTHLPKLQQQVRYEYQKLLRVIGNSCREITTGLFVVKNHITFSDDKTDYVNLQLRSLELAIKDLNIVSGGPKAHLEFSLLKLDKELKTFKLSSELNTPEMLEGEVRPSTISLLKAATKNLGTDETIVSQELISSTFPNALVTEIEEDQDVLL